MSRHIDPAKLREIAPREYATRFVCGGVITVITGLITHRWGPVVGGLFLGFPAILPASLTLIQHHEGLSAARHDSLGSIAGSIGLAAFGLIVWRLPAALPGIAVLAIAATTWCGVALGVYLAASAIWSSRRV